MQGDEYLKKLNNWKNSDNYAYYDNVPIEVLQDFAVQGGFENGCDIDLIYDFLKDKDSILELGAAYGRVIKNILTRGYTGKLYALERSPHLYQHLQVNFGNQAEIIHGNVQTFQPNFKVDIVLMMWTFISDFSKLEQLKLLQQAISWLKPDGFLILDIISHTLIPCNVTFSTKQTHVIFSKYGTLHTYVPSTQEINEYARRLKARFIENINYKTDTQKERILHILRI